MKKDGYLEWTIPKYGTDEAKKFFKTQGIKIKKIKQRLIWEDTKRNENKKV